MERHVPERGVRLEPTLEPGASRVAAAACVRPTAGARLAERITDDGRKELQHRSGMEPLLGGFDDFAPKELPSVD